MWSLKWNVEDGSVEYLILWEGEGIFPVHIPVLLHETTPSDPEHEKHFVWNFYNT